MIESFRARHLIAFRGRPQRRPTRDSRVPRPLPCPFVERPRTKRRCTRSRSSVGMPCRGRRRRSRRHRSTLVHRSRAGGRLPNSASRCRLDCQGLLPCWTSRSKRCERGIADVVRFPRKERGFDIGASFTRRYVGRLVVATPRDRPFGATAAMPRCRPIVVAPRARARNGQAPSRELGSRRAGTSLTAHPDSTIGNPGPSRHSGQIPGCGHGRSPIPDGPLRRF